MGSRQGRQLPGTPAAIQRIRGLDIEQLRAAQRELLRQAAVLLKPGGAIVYTTRSLAPQESTWVVNEFLGARACVQLARA